MTHTSLKINIDTFKVSSKTHKELFDLLIKNVVDTWSEFSLVRTEFFDINEGGKPKGILEINQVLKEIAVDLQNLTKDKSFGIDLNPDDGNWKQIHKTIKKINVNNDNVTRFDLDPLHIALITIDNRFFEFNGAFINVTELSFGRRFNQITTKIKISDFSGQIAVIMIPFIEIELFIPRTSEIFDVESDDDEKNVESDDESDFETFSEKSNNTESEAEFKSDFDPNTSDSDSD